MKKVVFIFSIYILTVYLFCNLSFAINITANYTYDNLNRLTQIEYDNGDIISYTYDLAGNRLTKIVLADTVIPGDINDDGIIDLLDCILALQITSGILPTDPVYIEADVNGDNRIGIEETVFILEKVAGIRE